MRTLVRQILGAIAEYERATIVRRMQDGRKAKGAAGGYAFGSPKIGYRAQGKQLVEDEGEQATLVRICELHSAGASLRQVADTLTAEGYKPKRGGAWHTETVRRIVGRLG